GLEAHLAICEACQSCGRDFEQIVHQHLPLAAAPREHLSEKIHMLWRDNAYRTRFAARAQAAGIALAPRPSSPRVALGAAVCAMAVLIAIAGYLLQQSSARYRSLAANYVALKQELAALRERPTIQAPPVNPTFPPL